MINNEVNQRADLNYMEEEEADSRLILHVPSARVQRRKVSKTPCVLSNDSDVVAYLSAQFFSLGVKNANDIYQFTI